MFSENLHGWQEFCTTAGRTKYQIWKRTHIKTNKMHKKLRFLLKLKEGASNCHFYRHYHNFPHILITLIIVIIIFTLAWICSGQKHHPIRLSQFLSHFFAQIGQLGICSKIRLLSFNVNELLNFGDPDIFYLWIYLKTLYWLRTGSQYLLCEHPMYFRFIRMMYRWIVRSPRTFNSLMKMQMYISVVFSQCRCLFSTK